MVQVKFYFIYTSSILGSNFPQETQWWGCMYVHVCLLASITSVFLFGFPLMSHLFYSSFEFYHIYSICTDKITHFPGWDFMAFNNHNYTFQVLYQSSVLCSLAGILVFKNAEELLRDFICKDELYLVLMAVILFITTLKASVSLKLY